VVTPNDKQFLAWGTVSARRMIVNAGIPHIQAINDCQTKWRTALNHPAAHAIYMVMLQKTKTERAERFG
jgi:hypothetical protein